MQTRSFGSTGLQVSVLGFGAGHIGGELDDTELERLLHGVVDLGVTLIDTAPGYGQSEERIGRILAGKRERLVLSTKGGYGVPGTPDWTGDVITRGIDQALHRLRTDRIDIFHLHSCPRDTLYRDDIVHALRQARQAGKIRVAAYSGENDALDAAVSMDVFSGVQCSVNVCDQRALAQALPRAEARGLGVIGKRPVANAPWRFSDRPYGDYAETYWERLHAMQLQLHDPLDTFLRFAAFAPAVSSVIVGTRQLDHLRHNAAVVARGALSDDETAALRLAFNQHDRDWIGQI